MQFISPDDVLNCIQYDSSNKAAITLLLQGGYYYGYPPVTLYFNFFALNVQPYLILQVVATNVHAYHVMCSILY